MLRLLTHPPLQVNETAFVRGDLQTENLVVGGGAEIGSQYRGEALALPHLLRVF